MVVVVVDRDDDDATAPCAAAWGTWEELVLGGAVLRHGPAAWHAVAAELRARSPCSFSPKECEAKYSEIQARYSACDAWFEELRKQRVAELKRELRKSESFIGSLQSVIESLSNSKHDNGNLGCHTESCSHTENAADTTSSSKGLSKDRSSAASFTEEATDSQKSQKVQNTSADTLSKPHAEKKLSAKDGLLWGSKKKRGLRDKRVTLMAVDSIRDGENTSAPCIKGEGSSEGCMKKLKIPKIEPGLSVCKTPCVQREGSSQPQACMKELKVPNTEPGVSVCERAKPTLADILNSISTQGDCKMLQHQIDIQRKRARYKKMIRQHMDFRILRSKIKSGAVSSAKELLKDMLVFVNNVLTFYPKATLEHMAAIELRGLICKTVQQSSGILSMSCEAAGIRSDSVIKKPKAGIARGPVIKKTAGGIAIEPVIKKTAAGIAIEPVIKKAAAGIASGLVTKKVAAAGIASEPVTKKAAAGTASEPVTKKAVTAGTASEPITKKAAAGTASEPVTKKAVAAGTASEPITKKAAAGTASEPVTKKAAAGTASEPVIKRAAARIARDPVDKKAVAGAASAAVTKKISRALPPVRNVPRDAKRSRASSRGTGSSVSEGETKELPALPSDEKTAPPAKKRGVGRPPKSGQKRAASAAPQDSPNKGRKRTRR